MNDESKKLFIASEIFAFDAQSALFNQMVEDISESIDLSTNRKLALVIAGNGKGLLNKADKIKTSPYFDQQMNDWLFGIRSRILLHFYLITDILFNSINKDGMHTHADVDVEIAPFVVDYSSNVKSYDKNEE